MVVDFSVASSLSFLKSSFGRPLVNALSTFGNFDMEGVRERILEDLHPKEPLFFCADKKDLIRSKTKKLLVNKVRQVRGEGHFSCVISNGITKPGTSKVF